jgi:uncharacterized membrane protein YccC
MLDSSRADELLRAFRAAQLLHEHAPHLRQLLVPYPDIVRDVQANLSLIASRKRERDARGRPDQRDEFGRAAKRQKTGHKALH